tara:strand:+ start:7996 stop:8334 length:339 start_codon:yes stop_codon:yes gene_type:complete
MKPAPVYITSHSPIPKLAMEQVELAMDKMADVAPGEIVSMLAHREMVPHTGGRERAAWKLRIGYIGTTSETVADGLNQEPFLAVIYALTNAFGLLRQCQRKIAAEAEERLRG